MNAASTVYLVPSVLAEGATQAIPPYVLEAVKQCQVFFVENERTARRFLKSIWKEMVIDDYQWHSTGDEQLAAKEIRAAIAAGHTIGVLSEAGCPGIADPGQSLAMAAHRAGASVRPLVGPSSILLALMASGFNGQQFRFNGYLPIDRVQRTSTLRRLESESRNQRCTQLFIETPYRNNQLMETLLSACQPDTWISVAADLTSPAEWISTKQVKDWKKALPELHKRPVIFSLLAS